MKAVGYIRVSTDEQADNGASLDGQRRTITEEAERRGWELVEVFEETGSGKSTRNRPKLEEAQRAVETNGARVLVVTKLDRLARSVVDFGAILERSRKNEWQIVVLDLGVDTTKPHGKMIANVLMSIAEWEREMIGVRTREALAEKRRQGVRLGGTSRLDPETRRMVVTLSDAGESLRGIARALNEAGIPTGQGGSAWYPTSVKAALLSAQRDGVSA